ncbi:helix-turn-helix domain-containing protein [Acidisoma cellulosilyticum]|nr:helix-turn-helix transcriptional regulator [Acidisoma cellulosilyticum]
MCQSVAINTKTDLRLVLAKNIRRARQHAELSQRDIQKRTGIAQAYLSQLEGGRWSVGLDTIAKIAESSGFVWHELLNPDFNPVMSA